MQTCRDLHVYREKERILWIFKGSFVNKKKKERFCLCVFFCVNVMDSLSFLRIFYLFISITILPRSRFGPSRFYLV